MLYIIKRILYKTIYLPYRLFIPTCLDGIPSAYDTNTEFCHRSHLSLRIYPILTWVYLWLYYLRMLSKRYIWLFLSSMYIILTYTIFDIVLQFCNHFQLQYHEIFSSHYSSPCFYTSLIIFNLQKLGLPNFTIKSFDNGPHSLTTKSTIITL